MDTMIWTLAGWLGTLLCGVYLGMAIEHWNEQKRTRAMLDRAARDYEA